MKYLDLVGLGKVWNRFKTIFTSLPENMLDSMSMDFSSDNDYVNLSFTSYYRDGLDIANEGIQEISVPIADQQNAGIITADTYSKIQQIDIIKDSLKKIILTIDNEENGFIKVNIPDVNDIDEFNITGSINVEAINYAPASFKIIATLTNNIASISSESLVYAYTDNAQFNVFFEGFNTALTNSSILSLTVNLYDIPYSTGASASYTKTFYFNIQDVTYIPPTCFIIDQRGTISDPDSMISDNYKKGENNTLIPISKSSSENTITWLKQNSHMYVGARVNGKIKLKQLKDTTRNAFLDNSSSINFITNKTGNYDVWMKFPTDIYYKMEPWYPEGSTETNEDYILVSIAKELPIGDDGNTWNKWDKNHLIGCYEGYEINNICHSISGVIPTVITANTYYGESNNNNIEQLKFYELTTLLFYGLYSTTKVQDIIGTGSEVRPTNAIINYYRKTGLNNSNTHDSYGLDHINDVISDNNIKQNKGISTNFWYLENWIGNTKKRLLKSCYLQLKDDADTYNIKKYVKSLLRISNISLHTLNNGIINITKNDTNSFTQATSSMNNNTEFFVIKDSTSYICIELPSITSGWITKLNSDKHHFAIPKETTTSSSVKNIYFTNYFMKRSISFTSNTYDSVFVVSDVGNGDKIGPLSFSLIGTATLPTDTTKRAIFLGTDETVEIINNNEEF